MSEPSSGGHRFGSVAVDREVALTANELDAEWRAVILKEKQRVDTARAAIEALMIAHDYDYRQHATVIEELQDKVETLREQLRKCKDLLEEEERKRAQLKVETVSRGREIADMREAISKLKKEKEAEKN